MSNQTPRRGRPWSAGVSGNPHGRPRGARNRSTLALEKLMHDDGAAIVRAVLVAAKGGDTKAARMILDRISPAAKERAVCFALPDTGDAAGVDLAQRAVIEAAAAGELTPSEAQAFSALIEARRKAVETNDLAARIEAIEARVIPR